MRKIMTFLIVIALLMPSLAFAAGPPGLPSSFYGSVKIGGQNIPPDTIVSAWIHGIKCAEAQVQLYLGVTYYSLSVPADDPSTGLIEGGKAGDTVEFYIGERKADQVGIWQSGSNYRLDLSAPALIFLPAVIRP